MADIGHLGGLQQTEALDLGNYADVKESSFRLPAAGKYTLRTTDSFPQASFGRSKAGALSIQIDPTIVGPAHENFTIRFTKVSAKTFDRNGKRVSQLGDYLRAVGNTSTFTNEQEQADAVEASAGALFDAQLDWRAYNGATGFSLQGMHRFPKNEDGTYQSWAPDPNDYEKDETGAVKLDAKGNKINKRVRANLVVEKYYPKV